MSRRSHRPRLWGLVILVLSVLTFLVLAIVYRDTREWRILVAAGLWVLSVLTILDVVRIRRRLRRARDEIEVFAGAATETAEAVEEMRLMVVRHIALCPQSRRADRQLTEWSAR
jgi:uncharacterized membrane protein